MIAGTLIWTIPYAAAYLILLGLTTGFSNRRYLLYYLCHHGRDYWNLRNFHSGGHEIRRSGSSDSNVQSTCLSSAD